MTQRERQILQWIEADPMISQEALAQRAGITRSSVAVHISNLMRKGYIAGKGYVLRSGTYAVVAGGVNVDIGGRSFAPMVARDSNPGRVTTGLGGVGRNIAHNLSLLGVDVRFLTAFGDDLYAQRIAASCGELGIDISHALQVPGGTTSTYLFLNDTDGDMALAVADMEICEKLTPDVIASQMDFLNSCPYVVLDANLRADTLAYIADHCHSALCADAVSVKKADRLRPILHRLSFLKVNRAEAEVLVGFPVDDMESVSKASAQLHAMGIPVVAITLGSSGAFLSVGSEAYALPPMAHDGVNYSGCGDAFFAGILHGLTMQKSTLETLRCGLAMAALSASSPCAVSPDVSSEALEQILSESKEEE